MTGPGGDWVLLHTFGLNEGTEVMSVPDTRKGKYGFKVTATAASSRQDAKESGAKGKAKDEELGSKQGTAESADLPSLVVFAKNESEKV